MKKIKQVALELWRDESAQGATEYILLLMIVVAIVILFKDKIRGLVQGKLGDLEGGLGNVHAKF